VKVGFKSLKGLNRDNNEDAYLVDENLGLFIVADGMGGHNAGQVASRIAVEEISNTISQQLTLGKDPLAAIDDAVTRANRVILDSASWLPEWADMGTTVVIAFVKDGRVTITHVGDSRAYLIRNGNMVQLTEDHSFVAECMKQGWLTAEQARTHQSRHGLTMALGVEDEVEPETTELSWDGGSCILLCSDGLIDVLDDSDILEIIQKAETPQAGCDTLVQKASERGNKDDVTVILFCAAERGS
jgi:PPM family protein phosphatase